MACGLPVVCSEGGGNREVVVDETTGFVIAPFDAERLAMRLVWLREHEVERGAMGDAGHRRIREVFSIARMVANYVSVYENAIEASRRYQRPRGRLLKCTCTCRHRSRDGSRCGADSRRRLTSV